MLRNSTRRRSPVRLHLQEFEARDTPAGTVTAAQSGGLLTLIGDGQSNFIQLFQIGASTSLFGVNTTIEGGTTFNNVTSVRTVMKGGDDHVNIDPFSPFALTGAANFDLGDGSNTLGLATGGQISLGSLAVKAGDGDDAITVNGFPGSAVAGNVSFNLGAGDTDVDLIGLGINGSDGVRLVATGGANSLNIAATQVSRAVTVAVGLGGLNAAFTGSTLSSLSVTDTGVNPANPDFGVELDMTTTTVTGAIQIRSRFGASVVMSAVSAGSLSVISGRAGTVMVAASGAVNLTTGGVTIRGGDGFFGVSPSVTFDAAGDIALLAADRNELNVVGGQLLARGIRLTSSLGAAADECRLEISNGLAAIDNDIVISGQTSDFVSLTGTVTARNLSLTGTTHTMYLQGGGFGPSVVSLAGTMTIRAPRSLLDVLENGALTVGGNLTMSGTTESGLNAATGSNIDVGGTLSIDSGLGAVNCQFSGSSLQIGRDLTVKGQQSRPLVLNPSAASSIDRNVTYSLGPDDDELTINSNVAVQGTLTINAGAGNNIVTLGTSAANFPVGGNLALSGLTGDDSVTLNRVQVTGATRVATGSGADLLQINGPSTFTGATAIDLGAGDDTWNAASDAANNGAVTFTGTVNARLGTGNDTLRLGLTGGGPVMTVNFSTSPLNKIDGAAGLNFYDDEAALTTGTVDIVNFTDPM